MVECIECNDTKIGSPEGDPCGACLKDNKAPMIENDEKDVDEASREEAALDTDNEVKQPDDNVNG